MLHVIKHRKIFYIFSMIVLIPGLISLFMQGLNLGIDFKSGSIIEVRFDKAVQVELVRKTVESQGLDSSKIQQSGDRDFLIRLDTITEKEGQQLVASFSKNIGPNQLLRNDFVAPVVGKELVYKALGALFVASIIMVIYITIRFEFNPLIEL
ncbi:MAG: protein translocase subunit SecF, partial [Peptococcaceae bacterium]|nr:protein translocase subunit SecF [Peptococcaceae bacterium]